MQGYTNHRGKSSYSLVRVEDNNYDDSQTITPLFENINIDLNKTLSVIHRKSLRIFIAMTLSILYSLCKGICP